jgi:hypothetical protein
MSFELPAYHSVMWLICLQHTGANTHRPANADHTYNAPTRGAVTFVPRFNGGGSVSYTSRWSTGSRQQITTPQVYPVGYAGHVPGLISGNLHGAPWRDLLTPRSADSIAGTATSPRCLPASPRAAVSSAPKGPSSTPGRARRASPRSWSAPSRRLSVGLYCG